jgi:Putative beta-barrel porin 2
MRNYAAGSGLFLIFAVILISVLAQETLAQEAVSSSAIGSSSVSTTTSTSSSSSSTSSTSSAGSAPVPIQQVGTGIFSRLPFKLSLSVHLGYDDNVATSSSGGTQGSGYTNASLDLSYDFGSPRTRLSLGLGVGGSYYWQSFHAGVTGTNNYDLSDHLSLSIAHKATPRLTLSASTYFTYQTEPDFSFAQGLNRRSGNYFLTSDRFSAAYLWTPRFSTETSYNLVALHYDDSIFGQFEDRFENTFGNEFSFAIWATTKLVLDYRLQITSYVHESNRDSVSHYALAGFDETFNPRLSGSLRAGAQFVDYQQQGSLSSPYFQASLNYVLSKRTSVAWNSQYSIEQADVAGNQARKTFRTGLNGKYDVTPRISASLAAYYARDDYQSVSLPAGVIPGFTEESFDLSLALRYSVTRYFGVGAGYGYTEVSSDSAFREYSRNRYWAGFDVTF